MNRLIRRESVCSYSPVIEDLGILTRNNVSHAQIPLAPGLGYKDRMWRLGYGLPLEVARVPIVDFQFPLQCSNNPVIGAMRIMTRNNVFLCTGLHGSSTGL